jgi:type I restriction enzyme S subunit
MVKEGYKEIRVRAQKYFIPNDWEVNKLKDLCKIEYGKDQSDVENKEGQYPILGTGGLIGYSDDYLYDEPSVLIGRKGTIDEPQYMENPFWTIDTLFYTKIAETAFPKWLYYYLNYYNLDLLNEATGVPSLNRKNLNNLSIPTPALNEQKKIASILSSVDKSIDKTSEVIEETNELKNGLMQKLLTKGIGHSEFKEVRLGVKTYTVPVNWEITTIEEISNGKPRYGANSSAKDFNPDLPRYVRITDLSEDGFLKNDDKKSIPMDEADSYFLEKGDIVFARSGATVGKTYIYDPKDGLCAYAGYLIRFKINTEKVIPKYLLNVTHSYYYSAWVKSMIRATSQPNINSKEYASFDLLLPPLDEQKKIASILSSVDAKIQKEEEYKAKLEKLKKGLMQKLLTGEIRVNTEMEV